MEWIIRHALAECRIIDNDHAIVARFIGSIKGLGDLWAETTGDPRVTIAVLDGPVDRTHPALAGADLTAVEVTVPALPRPGGTATRHGTLVASLIFGRHGSTSPVAGIAPGCRGIVVPVFSDLAGHRPDRGRPALHADVLAARSGPGDPAGGGAWGSSDQHQWWSGCVVGGGLSHAD